MKQIHNLPNKINKSIHEFSVLKFSETTIEKNSFSPFLSMYYDTLQPLYSDWLIYVRMYEEETWGIVKPLKNNLQFTSLVLGQFKKEVKKQITKPIYHIELKKKDHFSIEHQEYFNYANELFEEVHGVSLEKKEYTKRELINLIKECERIIFLAKTSPDSKIIHLFS